jgi:predicted RNA-binding Zn-ribbon protein involved in translation (DUF1610 family)
LGRIGGSKTRQTGWGLLKWAFEQSGVFGVMATAAWLALVSWASPHLVEVSRFIDEQPARSAIIAILLAFSLYGIADASAKLWRWLRRPAVMPDRLMIAIPPTPPDPLPPDADYTWYTRDRFPLRIGLRRGLFQGLGCRWKWDGTRVIEPAFRCPECWEIPTLEMEGRTGMSTRFTCESCGFEAVHASQPGEILAELALLARDKARDGQWRAVVAREVDRKGNAP